LESFKQDVKRQFVCDTFTTPDVLATRVATDLAKEIDKRSAVRAGDLTAMDWKTYSEEVRSSVLTLLSSGQTPHEQATLRDVAAVLVKRYPRDTARGGASRADVTSATVVARHEFFGSLLYHRSYVDYLPFDREATDIFIRAQDRPVAQLSAALSNEEQRATFDKFVALCRQADLFTAAGTFNGVFLEEARPAHGRLSAPTRAILSCTNACPYTCDHCVFSAGTPHIGELTTREVTKLIDELVDCGCFLLEMDGGEPLVRADLPRIVEHANDNGVSVRIATNGAAATREVVAELGRVRIQSVKVRLDGATANVCDAMRRQPGAFDAAIEGITRLKGLRTPIDVQWMVTKTNAHQLASVAELVRRLELQLLRVYPVLPVGRAADHPHLLLSSDEIDRLCTEAEEISERTGLTMITPRSPRVDFFRNRCACGTMVCHVSSRGDVSPSAFLGAKPGDTLRERRLTDVWASSEAFRAWRDQPAQVRCASCSYYG
jgi:MoaA/NifB/PqqE/SkfB family radical SAM enzyme